MESFYIALILTLSFCISHSILTVNYMKNVIPLSSKNYRLFYNIISGISLGILTIALTELSKDPAMTTSPFIVADDNLKFFVQLLSFIGIIFIVGSLLQTNPLKFVGFIEELDTDLNIDLFYRFSRHPMYTGAILLLGPGIFISTNLIWIQQSIIFVLYFIFGSLHEELRLKHFLKGYETMYSRGHLFPWKKTHFYTLFGKRE